MSRGLDVSSVSFPAAASELTPGGGCGLGVVVKGHASTTRKRTHVSHESPPTTLT